MKKFTLQHPLRSTLLVISLAFSLGISAVNGQSVTCPVLTHNAFTDFNASSNAGTATTLWLAVHTKLSGQLTANGDYLLFSGGTLSFNGIGTSFGSSVSLPNGEIIADNTVSVPTTSFNTVTGTWVTRVPLGYSSSDIFISGDAITSSTGFTLTGGGKATVLTGSFSSNKTFSSSWFYGLGAYQPTFTNSTAGTINADNGIPVSGRQTGTPDDQTGGLVQGGSGGGGANFTGSNSSTDNFTACPAVAPVTPTLSVTQPSCTVATGTITVTSPVGAGLTYSINGTTYQSGSSFGGLAPGTYNVTVENSAGLISTAVSVVIITAPPVPVSPTVTVTEPTCAMATGTITITSPTGTGLLYGLNYTNYQAGTSFNSVAPGTYQVTVKNYAGCISSAVTAVINTGAPATPTLNITQPSCTVATGTITISAPAGTGFTYSIDGTNYQTGNSFSGLAAGTYSVSIKSSIGCISTAATAVIIAQPPTPAPPGVTIIQPTCAMPNGTIIVTGAESAGLLYGLNYVNYQSADTFSGVAPGSYQVTAKNDAGCISSAVTAVIDPVPAACACPVLTHNAFTDFNASSNAGTATTLWLAVHTKLSGQLTANGDYLLFSGGTLSFNGIGTSFGSSVSLPNGEIIADNTVSVPTTSFNTVTGTWVTRVPLGYSSSDIFISGDAITSSTGFTLTGGGKATVLTGSFSSNKTFSSSWFYGLGAYQPTFTNSTAGTINADNGIPVSGRQTGTPDDQTGGLVQGGSGGGGANFTGSNSSTDNFTACTITGSEPTAASDTATVVIANSGILIKSYPNPYSSVVNFNITTSESGRGSLTIYDLLGRRLATVFEGEFAAGVPMTVSYYQANPANREPLIYIFRIGNKIVNGKLLMTGY